MTSEVDVSPKHFNGALYQWHKELVKSSSERGTPRPEKLYITDYLTIYSCVLASIENGYTVYFYDNSPITVHDLGESTPRDLKTMQALLLKWNNNTVQPLDRTVIVFCYCLSAGLVPESNDEIQHFSVETLGSELLQQSA